MFEEARTYYDILEIEADATEKDIRESYLKLKSAFSKNAVATYSIFDANQAELELQDIENAFQILSNPEKRKEYDKRHGLSTALSVDHPAPITQTSTPDETDLSSDELLLIPPSTEFQNKEESPVLQDTKPSAPSEPSPSQHSVPASQEFDASLDHKIQEEIEWKGKFIQFIRLEKNVSIEEMASQTKISKNYLRAIEDDQYDKLPAPVFLRGFLIQICRILKLPEEKVVTAYISRYKQNVSDND